MTKPPISKTLDFYFEQIIRERVHGDFCVVGIDEVGTGAWAGPIVAAAVALDEKNVYDFYTLLDDSKRLRKTIRETLDPLIRNHALYVGLGVVTTNEINANGIARSRELALERAYFSVLAQCATTLRAVVDGRSMRKLRPLFGVESIFVNKADQKSLNVAAASIVAKVARDRMMQILDAVYPGYGFGKHKGYGVPEHRTALTTLGICDIHRTSIKPIRAIIDTLTV